MSLVWQATVLFAATNIDDMVVLSLFFGRANRAPGSTQRIVLGQYLGFLAILALSVAGAIGVARLPDHATAYLGLIPITLGVRAAFRVFRISRHRADDSDVPPLPTSALSVAGVTLANGGDNIAVYVPAFATRSDVAFAGIALVFLLLVGVWCLAGYHLTGHRLAVVTMQRWGHIIHPVALIVIGAVILVTGGAFGL